jgi:hypothetical protein
MRNLGSYLKVASFFILTSCASYTDQTEAVHSSFVASRYTEALEKLEASEIKEQSRNELLFMLEKAMILDRMGQLKSSRKLLLDASKKADELYTKSITKEISTYLVSEDRTEYAGEDFEKVAIHTFLALSFLEEGMLAEARVEARKINNKIAEMNQTYEKNPNKYSEDGFAWLLSAAIYEAKGEWDDAIIDYEKALKAYQGDFLKFSGGVPESLVVGYAHVATIRNRTDRLKDLKTKFPKVFQKYTFPLTTKTTFFIAETGAVARKVSESFMLPLNNQVVRYSWPVIKTGRTRSPPQVRIPGESPVFSEAIDFSEIGRETLEDKRTRYTLKSVARLIAKSKITDQVEQNFGPLGGLLANIVMASTETADTRSWTLLPQNIYVARVQSEASIDSYQINLDTKKVPSTSGKINFVRIK